MFRCTYRLTDARTVVTRNRLERLPRSGERVTLNNGFYVVDAVSQEGVAATISVSEYGDGTVSLDRP